MKKLGPEKKVQINNSDNRDLTVLHSGNVMKHDVATMQSRDTPKALSDKIETYSNY